MRLCKPYGISNMICYLRTVIFSNHQALSYLKSQKKVSSRHAKWVAFLEYTCVLKHLAGVKNRVVDTLSHCRYDFACRRSTSYWV